MLTELCIENFKPFGRPQVAECAPITLIYGPNSGGKSSILQSLLAIQQSMDANQNQGFRLIVRGANADFGSFKSLLHKHDTGRRFRIRISYDSVPFFAGLPHLYSPMMQKYKRTIALEFQAARSPSSQLLDSSQLSSICYELDAGRSLSCNLRRTPKCGAGREPMRWGISIDTRGYAMYEWADLRSARSFADFYMAVLKYTSERERQDHPKLASALKEMEGSKLVEPNERDSFAEVLVDRFFVGAKNSLPGVFVMKRGGGSDKEIAKLGVYLSGTTFTIINHDFGQLMNSLCYLGPLRTYPERQYLISGGDMESVGKSGEHTSQILYCSPPAFRTRLNRWLTQFDISYSLRIDRIQHDLIGEVVAMKLIDRRSRVAVGPSDVGFGIGQLLPILVQGIGASKSILCVEQPEIHLHPRLQASLADFFIETAGVAGGSRTGSQSFQGGNQWIIETHSEALMLRFQRRIRERKLDPSSVSVLYVRPASNGSADILRLRLDERGDFIDPWPDGFFEEGYREMFSVGVTE